MASLESGEDWALWVFMTCVHLPDSDGVKGLKMARRCDLAFFLTSVCRVSVAFALLRSSVKRRQLLMQEYAITSDDALVLDELPDAPILIVGAGYISVEFSGIFNSFGATVHLVYRKDLPLTGYALNNGIIDHVDCHQQCQ